MKKWKDLDNEGQDSAKYLAERLVEITGGVAFGLWQQSIWAGVFMFAFLFLTVWITRRAIWGDGK